MAAIDDLRKITKAIQKGIRQSLSRKELLEIGKTAVAIIQRRTRRGFGVAKSGGVRRRLAPLSAKYIKQRQRAKLSRFTSPRRSNLTFTGQMLASLNARVVKPGTVTISADGRRRDGKRNEDVAIFVSQRRPFLNLSKKEIEVLTEDYDRSLEAQLTRALKGL